MHLCNGRRYFPFNPDPAEIKISVIAHHLACNGRWNGATFHRQGDRIFYSVAEHSVYVCDYMWLELKRPDLALAALLHDAPEAFVGDLIRPLKYSPALFEPFKAVEKLSEKAVEKAFGVDLSDPLIKVADEAVCNAEAQQIIRRDPDLDWSFGRLHDDSKTAMIRISMLEPYAARELFMSRVHELRTVGLASTLNERNIW